MGEHLAVSPPEASRSFDDVLKLMRAQAEVPPGQDPCLGAFYDAMASLIETGQEIETFFSDIYANRPSLTPSHAVNLLFRAVQHIHLNIKGDRSYLEFESPDQWQPILASVLSSEDRSTLEKLMLTKDTITTKYQRYAGPRAIISSYWNGNPVNVADFGCGANVGLPGIELNTPFEEIVDSTPGQLVLKETSRPMNLDVGLAVDRENPEDPDVKEWSIACSYYPEELKAKNGDEKLEPRFKDARNTAFLQADLLSPHATHMIPRDEFDAVILSTVLYQRSPEERQKILEEANRAAKATGVVIVQDFATKDLDDSSKLIFNGAWGGGEFGYRTFIVRQNPEQEVLEIFQWSDGRCHSVRPGEDFGILRPDN